MTELLTGAQILRCTLVDAGVDVMFGYPGGAIMPFYDALHGHEKTLRHVLVRHEQAAAHAADGYARASGRVGVCVATSGPGATNLVTGLATAHMDGSPVLAITGQVGRPMLGRDAFQETDVVGVTMPVTKHNVLVRDVEELADDVRDAMAIASRTSSTSSSTSRTSTLCFVTGIVTPTTSVSWNASRPSIGRPTWPVIARTGEPSMWAVASPVTRLVAPGPDVATHTPTRPLARAYPSAAWAAACSWRTVFSWPCSAS